MAETQESLGRLYTNTSTLVLFSLWIVQTFSCIVMIVLILTPSSGLACKVVCRSYSALCVIIEYSRPIVTDRRVSAGPRHVGG